MKPHDLAGALVAIHDGERLDALWGDLEPQAGASGVANGVRLGARLVGADAAVG